MSIDVGELLRMPKWTPLASFPSSTWVDGGLYALGGGIFLLVNSDEGPGEPVFAVGWASSPYWARRIWTKQFDPDFDEETGLVDQELPPDGRFLDLSRLTYRAIVDRNPAKSGRGAFVSASYRHPDGVFVSHEVWGNDGFKYHFSLPNPTNESHPVAIEVRLQAA